MMVDQVQKEQLCMKRQAETTELDSIVRNRSFGHFASIIQSRYQRRY